MAIHHNPQNGVLLEMMGCWEKFCSQPPEEQAPSLVLLQLKEKWETHSPNIHLIFIHVWTLYTFKFFLYTKHTVLQPTLPLFRRSRRFTRVNNYKQILDLTFCVYSEKVSRSLGILVPATFLHTIISCYFENVHKQRLQKLLQPLGANHQSGQAASSLT